MKCSPESPCCLLLLVWVALSCHGAAAQGSVGAGNWGSWRGPLGTGTASSGSPPTVWAEATEGAPAKNIVWKVAVPGLGISSPIVWEDRIYLTTAVETTRPGVASGDLPPQHRLAAPRPTVVFEFKVMALRRRDGAVLWSKTLAETVPHEGGHRTNSHASSSPVTDGERLYVSFGSRGLYCLGLDGEVLWSKSLGVMQTRRQYGEGASPAIFDDRLILNWDHEGDSFIAVFDKKTGEEVWRRPRDEVTSWSTPIVVTVDGRPQIIVNATTASRGYDLETGDVIWSLSGMTVNCIPHPIHVDGVVYLMSGYRGQMLQAVRLAGARGELEGTKHVQWTHRRNTSYVPSGAFHDGRLYFLRGNNGVLSCLDGNTGEVIYEGQRLRGLRSVYASPVCADGRIYVTSRDGVTVVFDHGPEFKQLALNRIDEPVDASMAVVGDAIYLRGHRHLYCISEVPSGGGAPRDPAPEEQASKGSALERVGSLGEGEERTASLSFGDLDLDGDMDVVVANGRHWAIGNEVYLNLEKGKFAEPRPLVPGATRSYAAPLADLDGDGDLDMVVGNDRQPSFVVWNEGGGRFRRGPDIGRVTNTRSVALADVDGKDGVDVIFVNRRDQNLICFNDGKGGFGRQAVFGRKPDATIRVAAADLDGDGDLDLVAANRNGQQNQVYINDGKGSFDVSRPYGAGDDNTRGVAVADLDGDGHLDIVNANIGQPDAIYYGDGAGGFPRREVLAGAAASYAVVVADLDGDHRPDIVVANGRGRNTVWMQRAPGRFDAVPFGSRDGVTYDVVAGDLDGDGRPELATANSGSRNHVYRYVER